ncbi:MAG TPA: hypothetical protein VJ249_08580 [Candidatus Bathyarchaeia archaeon]|nr:hypothetical protein [Candidatus Bathyarchaeia archaeon]
MLIIDEILDAIRNGEWHQVKEVAQKARSSESKVELVSGFLATYDFLEFDRKNKRVRLSMQLQRFLGKIREVESEERVGKKDTLSRTCFLS